MPLLITQDEIQALPPEPRQRFVAIEEICRRRYEQATLQEDIQWSYVQDMRLQYMSSIVAAAKYLGIEPINRISIPKKSKWNDDAYEDFVNELHFYAMQLALEAADRNSQLSITLQGSTRQRLSTLSEHLREQVKKLDLPKTRVEQLLARIDQFERELTKPRLTFTSVAALTIYLAAAVADLGGAASTVRGAMNLIEEAVGGAKEAEDNEVAGMLGVYEPRKLEPPRIEEAVVAQKTFATEDDIPF
jgi:hypothetical protein